MAIHTIGIISKPKREKLEEVVPPLLDWLANRDIQALMDHETADGLDFAQQSSLSAPVLNRSELPAKSDLILVLGGDGTLLSAARQVLNCDVPILAVNLGGLGFLTAVTIEELYPALDLVIQGKHQVECRNMLQIDVLRDGLEIATYHALNDVVLNKAAIARILDFQVYVDGQFVNLVKADGLIVSTPTGSTAYSLSAGGPIVFPSVDAFVITPICPHTLTNRPLVVPDKSRIEIVQMSEAEDVFLTVDGQVGLQSHSHDRVVCSLSPHRTSLVRPPHKQFFSVLRSKLKWGER